MEFQFLNREKPKKFNYKPQFYNEDEADDERSVREGKRPLTEQEEFARKLHNSWNSRRQRKIESHSTIRSVVWMAFIVFVLLFVVYKFLNL